MDSLYLVLGWSTDVFGKSTFGKVGVEKRFDIPEEHDRGAILKPVWDV